MRTRNHPTTGLSIGQLPAGICASILLIVFTGCAHTWSPGQVPPVPMESVGPLGTGLTVDLINNQPETKPQLFAGTPFYKHYANYNEWTEFFNRYWADELMKRKVGVNNQSPNKILVKLDTFLLSQGFAKVRTNMRIHLSSPDNSWSKVLYETDTSGWSMGRAFGSLIHHTVEKMMLDPEIMGRMRPGGVAK